MSSRQDDRVWTHLTESVIGRIGGAVIEVTARATGESRIAGIARRSTATWRRLHPAIKSRAAGAFALAAAATHVTLVLPHHAPGAWWLILPSLAGALGVALIALSFLAPRSGAAD
jgi:hypothetical protein